MSKYIPKEFAPRIYSAWTRIFQIMTERERSEVLLAIAGYPNYEPADVPLWSFLKGEIDRQHQTFKELSKKQSDRRKGKGETADDHGQPPSTADDHGQPPLTNNKEEGIRNKEDGRENMEDIPHSAPSHLTSQIVDLYNEIASGHFPQMKVLTEKRKKAVKRFADFLRKQTKSADDDALLSEAKSYFLRASRCDFLCGKNDRGWKADFDFLVNENKAVLVLEGKYDNSTTEKHEEPSIHKVKNPGPPPSKDDDGWKAQEAYFRRIGMFKGLAS